MFDHDDILTLRRRFVEFVQDGGVPIEDLGELDIEDEVVDDLLDKHRQNARVSVCLCACAFVCVCVCTAVTRGLGGTDGA